MHLSGGTVFLIPLHLAAVRQRQRGTDAHHILSRETVYQLPKGFLIVALVCV